MTDHAPLVFGVFLVIILGVLGALVVASENKAFAASSPLSVSVAGTTVTYSCPTCSTGASGVTSLNAIAGALHIQNNDSTLSFNTGFSHITVSLNLANPNTWTATQTMPQLITSGTGATDSLEMQMQNTAAGTNKFGFYVSGTGGTLPGGFFFAMAGIRSLWGSDSNGNFVPVADATYTIGTSSLRWANTISNLFSVYHASGDSNPTAQLGDGFLKFGAGGSSALDTGIERQGVASIVFEPLISSVDNLIYIDGVSTSNYDSIVLNPCNSCSNQASLFLQYRTSGIFDIGEYATAGSPSYYNIIFSNSNTATPLFGISTTGITNTQGFQTFSCSISGGSTSTVCNLAVTEPDTSYYAMCTGTGSGLIGDGISTAATSASQITLSYAAAGVLGGGANCLVVHH